MSFAVKFHGKSRRHAGAGRRGVATDRSAPDYCKRAMRVTRALMP